MDRKDHPDAQPGPTGSREPFSRSISRIIRPVRALKLRTDPGLAQEDTLEQEERFTREPLTEQPELTDEQAEEAYWKVLSKKMRTVLQSVIGYSELIEEDLLAGDRENPLRDLAKIRVASHILLELAREVELQVEAEHQKRRLVERLAALKQLPLDEPGDPNQVHKVFLEHLNATLTGRHTMHIMDVATLKPLASLTNRSQGHSSALFSRLITASVQQQRPCQDDITSRSSGLAVPVITHGSCPVVIVMSAPREVALTDQDVGIAVAFASQLSSILVAAQEQHALKRKTTYDALTGLLNRGAFFERARRTCSQKGLKAAFMLDIDHFKRVNDVHGHAAGDAVLREIARRLRATLRGHDEVGRYGGEEFALCVHDMVLLDARELAERLRLCVSASPIEISPGQSIPVALSIGLAVGPEFSADALLARADRALYDAKREGRNRVMTA